MPVRAKTSEPAGGRQRLRRPSYWRRKPFGLGWLGVLQRQLTLHRDIHKQVAGQLCSHSCWQTAKAKHQHPPHDLSNCYPQTQCNNGLYIYLLLRLKFVKKHFFLFTFFALSSRFCIWMGGAMNKKMIKTARVWVSKGGREEGACQCSKCWRDKSCVWILIKWYWPLALYLVAQNSYIKAATETLVSVTHPI